MKRYSLLGLVLVAVLVALAGAASAQDAKFVGNAKCKMCHNKADKKIWDSWKAQKHAKALETLKTDAAKEAAKKAGVTGDPSTAPECLQCHVTSYDAAKKAPAAAEIKLEDGVQCESCHGAASLHTEDGKKKMTDKTIDMSKHIAKDVKEEACKKCHNEKSPTFKGFNYAEAKAKVAHK